MYKQISPDSIKNKDTFKLSFDKSYIIYMWKQNLELNYSQGLTCHKILPNQTKPNQTKYSS